MPVKKYRITIRYQGQELTGEFEGEGDSIDGGCCTGSIQDALKMAVSQSL